MTSFMLSCVDAGLMTHSKCNDNDMAGASHLAAADHAGTTTGNRVSNKIITKL